jgi:hypothetical protein
VVKQRINLELGWPPVVLRGANYVAGRTWIWALCFTRHLNPYFSTAREASLQIDNTLKVSVIP